VADQPALLSTVRAARRTLAEVGPAFTRFEDDFARVSLPEQDCDVLRDLLVGDRARVVVEIGLAYGSSALAIGEALVLLASAGSTYVVIDPYQEHFHHAGWDAITAAGLDGLCTLVAERSFVDGSHIFHRVFVDLAYLSELVRPGGLIILDDCEWPSVATAARYFELNMGWQPADSRTPTRLRAFRVPDPRMEPAFADFSPFHLDDAPPP
jgi:predicted O-methyltransferase YrrM